MEFHSLHTHRHIQLDALYPQCTSIPIIEAIGPVRGPRKRVYNEACAFVRTESSSCTANAKNPALEHLLPHGQHLSLPRTAL
jgi:hypothetical protein